MPLNLKKLVLSVAIIFASFALINNTAKAREDWLRPAMGDVLVNIPGWERAATANGVVNLYYENGNLAPGYPLRIKGQAAVSSPLLADINNDGALEIIFIGRDKNNNYWLNAYVGDGQTFVFSEPLNNQAVYYDPVELRQPGIEGAGVAISNNQGKIISYYLTYAKITSSTILTEVGPVSFSLNPAGDEIYVSNPGKKTLNIYSLLNNKTALVTAINTAESIYYPPAYGVTNTLYAVSAKKLYAYNKTTGSVLAGFPVALPANTLAEPILAEVVGANIGQELAAPLSNGNSAVFTLDGKLLFKKIATRSLLQKSLDSSNSLAGGLFSSIKQYAVSLYTQTQRRLSSVFSTIKLPVTDQSKNFKFKLTVLKNNVELFAGKGNTYNLGQVDAGNPVALQFTITNTGGGVLKLLGNPAAVITGKNANLFTLNSQPVATILAGDSTTFTATLLSKAGGDIFAQLQLIGDGVNPSYYVAYFIASSAKQYIMYEDAEDGNTVGWVKPLNGLGSVAANVADDELHGKVISFTGKSADTYNTFTPPLNNPWQYPAYAVLAWDLKYSQAAGFMASVNTTLGVKNIYYSTKVVTPGPSGNFVYFRLDGLHKDGAWHTLSRDLQKDLQAYFPAASVTGLISFTAYGTGKVDNIRLIKTASLGSASGVILDEDGKGLDKVIVMAKEQGVAVISNKQGKFILPNLPPGEYNLVFAKNGYQFSPTTIVIDNKGTDVNDLAIKATLPPYIVYEDAEAGNTANWVKYGSLLSTLANVADDEAHGRVIAFNTAPVNMYQGMIFTPKMPLLVDLFPIFQLDVKYASKFALELPVSTQDGRSYRLRYSTDELPGYYDLRLHIRLPKTDGSWRTITRNLQKDIAAFFPNAAPLKQMLQFTSFGTARLDNIILRRASPLASISGVVKDERGFGVAGVIVTSLTYGYSVITDVNGKYNLPGLPPGNYQLSFTRPNFTFPNLNITVDKLGADLSNQDVVGVSPDELLYSDAENGLITGWILYSNRGSSIIKVNNVADDLAHGRVIELSNGDTRTYMYYTPPMSNPWNYPADPVLQWDIKYAGDFDVVIAVNTNAGIKNLHYSSTSTPGQYGNHYVFKVNANYQKGTWLTMSRNLQQDIKIYAPNVTATAIKEFKIYGGGRVDNLKSIKTAKLATVSGAVTNQNGQPVKGVLVTASPYVLSVITDVNGKYNLPGLPPGKYTLTFKRVNATFPASLITINEDGSDLVGQNAAGEAL